MGLNKLDSQKRKQLLSKTPYVLPDNPSDKGLSAKQIKAKMYEGTMQLFDWMSDNIETLETDLYESGLVANVGAINTALEVIEHAESRISALESGKVPKDLSIVEHSISAKEMTVAEQGEVMLYVDNGGTPSKINLNNLDYSKITVTSNMGEADIRANDFAFEKKED